MSMHIKLLVYPLYLIAFSLVVIGFWFAGIHRVLILTGFILAYIAYSLNKISLDIESTENKVIVEIITLGVSITFVLLLLWGVGSETFKGL